MKTGGPWLNADIQARIEPPLVPLTKAELEEKKSKNIIKVKIWRNPSQATSETYKFNMSTFDDDKPINNFVLLRNWIFATDRTRTTSLSGGIIYLRSFLRRGSLR